jgi:hypothetical protein
VKQLTLAARLYVTAVVGTAAIILCALTPGIRFEHPWLFAALFVLSCASAAMKISLPLTTDVSTQNVSSMSVSYAVDFVALMVLGLDQTLIIAAAGAFSQSAWKNTTRRPLHRTLFSVATLVITVTGAGLAFNLLSVPGDHAVTAVAQPLVGAAAVYFLLNSGLIAVAIALTSRKPGGHDLEGKLPLERPELLRWCRRRGGSRRGRSIGTNSGWRPSRSRRST